MSPSNALLPPEDFGEDLATGAIVIQPKITNGPKVNLTAKPEAPKEFIIAEIPDNALGDLASAPGLDEYRSFAREKEPLRLLELSSTLQARGHSQRALLALERIIDTSNNVSPENLQLAADDISAFPATLPRWNVDSSAEIELTLLISTSGSASDAIKEAALEVASLIRKHSGDQLQIVIKIRKTPALASASESGEGTPALTISFQREDFETPVSTAALTLSKGGENEAENLMITVFQSVRAHLTHLNYPSPKHLDSLGKELLTLHITRLMWRDFAESLTPQLEEVAPGGN